MGRGEVLIGPGTQASMGTIGYIDSAPIPPISGHAPIPLCNPLKKKCPRLFTGGKYTGRLHVWETQGPVAPFQRLALEL
jgi:hypothetical protein